MLHIFNRQEQLLAVLDNSPYYNIKHVERLNGENTLTFSIAADHADSQFVAEGNTVAFRDIDLEWQIFEIRSVTDLHSDTLERTAHCEHISYELFDEIIRDIRPTNVSAAFALSQALTGTRWTAGTVSDFGLNSTNFFYESALSAVHKIAAIWGCDYRFRVAVTGGVISGRFVDLIQRGSVTGKQLSYGRHLESIERTVDTSMLVTALFGRGKGVQVETGGYGRRLTFADVVWHTPVTKPLGQEWVGDPTALSLFGRQGRHRFGIFLDNEETEADVLLQKTWDELQRRKNPRLTYSVRCADLEVLLGYAHDRMRLGDTINIVDREFVPDLLISARVISVTRDLLNPENTNIMLDNYSEDLTTQTQAQNETNQTVSDRQGVWDRATAFDPATGRLPTTWLDGVINTLTNEVRAGTGTVTLTEGNGILIVDNPVNPTRALRLLGGILAIANSRHPVTGEWNWRTFGTGDGFTADQINAGEIRTSLVRITGNSNFYWSGDALMIINPVHANEQIRLSRDGIHFTTNGGLLWNVAIDFTGIRIEGTSGDGFTHYADDGVRVYDSSGALRTHLGRHESLSSPLAIFTRASVVYTDNGVEVAANTPRYRTIRKAGARWRDLFDTDQLATQYLSGGDAVAIWAVSGGILSGTGGSQAALLKTGLTLADGEVIVNTDQASNSGIIVRHIDNNNYYLLALSDDSGAHPTQNLRIQRRIAGVFADVVVADVVWTRGTVVNIRFTFHGSLLEAWFNGVRVISVVDTTFTGGGVGLYQSHAVTSRFLDFAVHLSSRALMFEEGVTNLLTANQSSIETDITGFNVLNRGHFARDASRAWHGNASGQLSSGIIGVTWTARTSGVGVALFGVHWSGDMWVAVGEGGTIITSPDTVTWTVRVSGTAVPLYDVHWSGSLWVVVGENGVILTSPDAVTWTARTSGVTTFLHDVHWSGSLWVVVGNNGVIRASTDAVTWTARTSGVATRLLGVWWSGSLWVAVGDGGVILTSPDAVTWTARTSGLGVSLRGVHWSGSLWVVVADSGFIRASTDAVTWTARTSGTGSRLTSVRWSGTMWVAVGLGGTIITSPDAVTWTARTSGTAVELRDIHWSGDMWVAVGEGGIIRSSSSERGWVELTGVQNVSSNSIRVFSGYLASAGVTPIRLRVVERDGTNAVTAIRNGDSFIGTAFTRQILAFTTAATTTNVLLQVECTAPGDAWFDGLQFENKPFATSWQVGGTPRAAETLLVPTAGIFNRGNWAVEGTYTPQFPINIGNSEKMLFAYQIDANNWVRFRAIWDVWNFAIMSGGVQQTITSPIGAVVQGIPYQWQISGNGSVMRLCVNGVQIGETTYTEPVGTLPVNIGMGQLVDVSSANGLLDDIRFSNRARTLAEHQTAFNSGETLAVDDNTTLLMLMDGSLLPTVRLFGLKIELAPGQIPLAIYRGAHQSLEIWQWQDNGAWIFYNSLTSDRTGVIGTDSRGFFIEGVNTAGTRVPVTIAGSLVTVQGNFTVTGTKAAMQQTETFGEQPLYARESPDIRYVIDGKAKIIDSECVIPIDPVFCECVEPDTEETPWFIHLTPWGDTRLKVSAITATHIAISGDTDGIFCWTLSCIRRGYRNKWFDKICEED